MKRWCTPLVALALAAAPAVAQDLASRIQSWTLTLPQALEQNIASYCTWGGCQLGPRLYHEPRPDGSLLVGWTDSLGDGHVSVVANGALGTTHGFPGTRVKGLVAHPDGSFAVLLWDSTNDTMTLSRRGSDGSQAWATNLDSTIADFDDGVGDSRLAFDGARYAAYYSVYGTSGGYAGHYGDQLKFVDTSGAVVAGGWDWGCSHSMSELAGYHPGLATMTVLCASDCYLQKGLNADRTHLLVAADGDCGGLVSLELGQMAASASTWKVIFNALDRTCCDAYGIGLATVSASYGASVAWLTSSDGSTERDGVIARLADDGGTERYLVGWKKTSDSTYRLAIVDGASTILAGPQVLGASVRWGERNDSFRAHADGRVTWVQGDASSTTLRVHRYSEVEEIFSDGFECGGTEAWSDDQP